MNIVGTQYTLSNRAFEIYTAGCKGNPHCTNCHNPKSWDFNQGVLCDLDYLQALRKKILNFDTMIDKIMVFGGEPLDQNPAELRLLLKLLSQLGKEVWLFTRYDLEEVPHYVKVTCDYIKCGRYLEELRTDDNTQYGIKLATSNQNIYKKGINYGI